METLRTRLDMLQWETNRLEAENRRLREEHPEESQVLMLEAELERSKENANDKWFKLVHLMAALRGNARSFYRSCMPTQKGSYPQLVGDLKKRFIPVKLTALQTQMYHSRKQGAIETVDDFAQELREKSTLQPP